MVFAVLVCGQIPSTGQLANIELEFPSCPRPVALGRAAQQALSEEEEAVTGRRTDRAGFLMVYDDDARDWVPLHSDSQIQHCDQVYLAQRADARPPLITDLPEPARPVTEGAQREPAGGWGDRAQPRAGAVVHDEDPRKPPRPVYAPAPASAGYAATPYQQAPLQTYHTPQQPAPQPAARWNHPAGTVAVAPDETAVRVAVIELHGLEPDALPEGRGLQAEVSLEGYEPLVTLPSRNAYWNEAFDFSPSPEAHEILLRIAVHSISQPMGGHGEPDGGPPSGAPVGGVEVSLRMDSFSEHPRRLRLPVLRGTTGQEVATVMVEVSYMQGPAQQQTAAP